MHEVLVNHFGGLSLPRKSVVRLTDRPDMTLDVYCGRKTTMTIFNTVECTISGFHLAKPDPFQSARSCWALEVHYFSLYFLLSIYVSIMVHTGLQIYPSFSL